ncbi:hypothetical protein AQZ59_00691 [Trueperella bernardiae]|uniref:Uncharacterized protein n=1 Tax=Trueperella bernardiae TaxID=59561 RepID=A0A0W1KKM8_9ACTO|nr:hypothetical protein AQZ59_00691 [Trueperella bernardiae]
MHLLDARARRRETAVQLRRARPEHLVRDDARGPRVAVIGGRREREVHRLAIGFIHIAVLVHAVARAVRQTRVQRADVEVEDLARRVVNHVRRVRPAITLTRRRNLALGDDRHRAPGLAAVGGAALHDRVLIRRIAAVPRAVGGAQIVGSENVAVGGHCDRGDADVVSRRVRLQDLQVGQIRLQSRIRVWRGERRRGRADGGGRRRRARGLDARPVTLGRVHDDVGLRLPTLQVIVGDGVRQLAAVALAGGDGGLAVASRNRDVGVGGIFHGQRGGQLVAHLVVALARAGRELEGGHLRKLRHDLRGLTRKRGERRRGTRVARVLVVLERDRRGKRAALDVLGRHRVRGERTGLSGARLEGVPLTARPVIKVGVGGLEGAGLARVIRDVDGVADHVAHLERGAIRVRVRHRERGLQRGDLRLGLGLEAVDLGADLVRRECAVINLQLIHDAGEALAAQDIERGRHRVGDSPGLQLKKAAVDVEGDALRGGIRGGDVRPRVVGEGVIVGQHPARPRQHVEADLVLPILGEALGNRADAVSGLDDRRTTCGRGRLHPKAD